MVPDSEFVRLEDDLSDLRAELSCDCSDLEVDLLRMKVDLFCDHADLTVFEDALSRGHAILSRELVRIEHALALI